MIKEKRETIQARINPANKEIITQAAKLREIPVSDYIRTTVLEQAKKEVSSSKLNILQLTEAEQLSFWHVIDSEPKLSNSQKELGKLMRGEL